MAATAPNRAERAARWDEEVADLGLVFRRVFRSFNRLRGRDTHLEGTELSHAQFELLIELQERGELAAGELASAARLAPGTVSQMLDHLVSSGHVERVRSATDRRVVLCALTPQGRAAIEAKRESWKRRWDEALEGVDPAELRAARSVLERLAEMVEGIPGGEASGAAGTAAAKAPQATRQPARR